jgi:hypothetical protein
MWRAAADSSHRHYVARWRCHNRCERTSGKRVVAKHDDGPLN